MPLHCVQPERGADKPTPASDFPCQLYERSGVLTIKSLLIVQESVIGPRHVHDPAFRALQHFRAAI